MTSVLSYSSFTRLVQHLWISDLELHSHSDFCALEIIIYLLCSFTTFDIRNSVTVSVPGQNLSVWQMLSTVRLFSYYRTDWGLLYVWANQFKFRCVFVSVFLLFSFLHVGFQLTSIFFLLQYRIATHSFSQVKCVGNFALKFHKNFIPTENYSWKLATALVNMYANVKKYRFRTAYIRRCTTRHQHPWPFQRSECLSALYTNHTLYHSVYILFTLTLVEIFIKDTRGIL